jgi:hypothetical protein
MSTESSPSAQPEPAGEARGAGPDLPECSFEPGERVVGDLDELGRGFAEICELAVSPDGERVAAVLEKEPDELRVGVAGDLWDDEFEKAWGLRFTPDGRAIALVRMDDEWTVCVDGVPWEERWEFAWNPKITPDGRVIAVQIKRDMAYSVAVEGKPWEEDYQSIRDYCLSPDGRRIAVTAQVEELPEADVFKFLEGTWTVVVEGKPWPERYLNVYAPAFSGDGEHVAAEVRTDVCEYTIAEDGVPWKHKYGCVWEPRYRTPERVVAPVRHEGAWTLAEGGAPSWKHRFIQLWNHVVAPDARRVAAVVSSDYGRWTVAVDDAAWPRTWSDMVADLAFSPDSARVAAAVKDEDQWTIAVDGRPWSESFDMVSAPMFAPDSAHVAAAAERGDHHVLVVDGKVWGKRFSRLWDPTFDPSGRHVLVRAVEANKVVRHVVPVSQILR